MPYHLLQRTKNFLSAAAFLAAAYIFYIFNSYYVKFFDQSYKIPLLNVILSAMAAFRYTFYAYLVSLFLIYFLERHSKTGKAVYAIRALKKIFLSPLHTFEKGILKEEKVAVLAVLVKIFFTPLLINWFLANGTQFLDHLLFILSSKQMTSANFLSIYQLHIFWMIFSLILFIDVFFFCFGYLVELNFFKNEIISVEPTLLGWIVTLICYPPFNQYASNIVMQKTTDLPAFSNSLLFYGISILILLLMAVFSWASVSLCFKASNLTHRGIVSSGPYRFVRHPAYICKNIAWWLGAASFAVPTWNLGFLPFIGFILSLSAWSYIYFLRALTEERHLRSVNHDYDKYMEKVPCRFVPFLV